VTQTADPPRVAVGDRIPSFEVPLTQQRLVMEAACNRDFAPMHHDPEAARATGAPTGFANTYFLQTFMELTLRRWVGVTGRLRMLEFAMKTFNCVGDVLSCSAEVTSVREVANGREIDLDVWIESHRGRTVTGRATVELPG
jgi:acyl dehydratase